MKEGTINKVVNDRGFGFLEDSTGQNFFFHKNDLTEGTLFYELKQGDRVTFEAGESPKGRVATKVRKIEPKEEEVKEEVPK